MRSNLFLFKLSYKPTLPIELKPASKKDSKSINAKEEQLENSPYQIKRNERFGMKSYGTLLDQGWGYVKIAILYDKIGTYITDKSSGCQFILINGTEKQEQWFSWKAITGKEYAASSKEKSGMKEFQNVFSQLIGFSGLNFTVQKVGNYHELIGTNLHKLAAGWSRIGPSILGKQISDHRLGNVIGRTAVVYRLVFWSPDQPDVLTGNHRFVIFSHDNNSGKHNYNYDQFEKGLRSKSILWQTKFKFQISFVYNFYFVNFQFLF